MQVQTGEVGLRAVDLGGETPGALLLIEIVPAYTPVGYDADILTDMDHVEDVAEVLYVLAQTLRDYNHAVYTTEEYGIEWENGLVTPVHSADAGLAWIDEAETGRLVVREVTAWANADE